MTLESGKRLFVSHAVADAAVVKAFVQLLESGIGVPILDIFCVSVKGQGITPGADFKNSIHQNLGKASSVVALISENFYNSAFCMCELGGVWLQSKDFIPILVPPATFSEMKAVLIGLQALRIDNSADLDQLRDELADRLGIKALATPRWNDKRDEFLNALPSLLASLPQSPVVKRSILEKVEKEKIEYQESLREANDEIRRLKKINEKLAATKDASSVAAVLKTEMPCIDIFEQTVDSAHAHLGKLERVTKEALFHYFIGESLPLGGRAKFDWDDAKNALDYKELQHDEGEGGVSVNESNVKVRKALAVLNELKKWLASEDADSDLWEWYSKENEGQTPDLEDRSFWDKNLW